MTHALFCLYDHTVTYCTTLERVRLYLSDGTVISIIVLIMNGRKKSRKGNAAEFLKMFDSKEVLGNSIIVVKRILKFI